ncbi:hypothetical protein AMECASPLE_006322 [Ameca splendens]|uniref:Uncharacterized protein n=1 Tax=Ameca splendens TaxID=208324 RepID=A0ABV0YAE5_9TELE
MGFNLNLGTEYRDTVKTTNPKNTPPTRNLPADKHPSTRPRGPLQTPSPETSAPRHPHMMARAAPHRTTTTACHTAEDRTQQRAPKTKAMRRCAPTSLPKIKPPHEKKTHCIQTQEHTPDTHTPASFSTSRKPAPKPTKGREPTEPKPKLRPARLPKPCRPLPQTESELRTVRNRNQNPNRNRPDPNDAYPKPKANHPPPTQKKTYSHPNIQATPRTHKTLDTQVDFTSLPLTLCRKHSLKE